MYTNELISNLKEEAKLTAGRVPISHNLPVELLLVDGAVKAVVYKDGRVTLSENLDGQWSEISASSLP